ncbi:MAG: oligosaccharide flippase family protein [Parachlamydiales bacterium]|jgi:O-antigen/teichoic acid export membrane protein
MHKQFSRDVLITMSMLIIIFGTRLIVPPLVLSYVKIEEYGFWSYAFILISYIGMSVFGIANVYVKYSAEYYVHENTPAINRLMSTGILSIAIAALVLIPLVFLFLPKALIWLNVPLEQLDLAFWLIFGTVLVFFFDLIFGAFSAIMQGIQKIAMERMISTSAFVLEVLLILFFLNQGYGIYSLLIAYSIRTIYLVAAQFTACKIYLPELKFRFNDFDKATLHLFYRFGGIVQLSGMLGVFNRSLEKIFAGTFFGPATTALYDIGEKIPLAAINFPGVFNMVLLPSTAYMHAKNEKEGIVELYLLGGRYLHMLAGLMLAFLWTWAIPLIMLWLGNLEKYSPAVQILTFFTIAYQMDTLTGPASAIYRSTGQPGKELYYAVGQLIICCAGFFIAKQYFGISLEAINWGVAGGMIIAATAYIIYSNSMIGISQRIYLQKVFLPGVAPYITAVIIALMLQQDLPKDRGEAAKQLLTAGFLYVAVTLPLLYLLLDKDERNRINPWAKTAV